jgi:hypothetical protein
MSTSVKSTRSITFGEAIAPFIEAGIRQKALLPVAPPAAPVCEKSSLARDPKVLGKKQGRFDAKRGVWMGLGTDAVTNGLDVHTQKVAQDWPTGNVGVVGRAYPGIDVDTGSEEFSKLAYQAVVEIFCDGAGNSDGFAERLRGDSLSRTYSFLAENPNDPIRTRRLKIRMPGDDPNSKARHGVDIQGTGAYYLIAGTHPSGDAYHWNPDRELAEMHREGRLLSITNGDIDRFLQRLTELVEAADGEVVHLSGGAAAGSGKRRDYGWDDPIAPPQQIIDALWQMPNTEANFGSRNAFIGGLASIRAALGRNALDEEWANKVRAWAVETSEGYCTDDYFDDAWSSLDKGVDCPRDHLPRLLRAVSGVRSLDGIDFLDDAAALSPAIGEHKAAEKAAKAVEHSPLLAEAFRDYVFHHPGTLVDWNSRNNTQPMRIRANPERILNAVRWWGEKSTDKNTDFLKRAKIAFGDGEIGLFRFLRALEKAHPFAFVSRVIKHPGFNYGEVVERYDTRKEPAGALNVRQRSQAQNAADRPRRNPTLAEADREHFLDFMRRGFGDGEVSKYLLDTFAYMVQTGKRPGHMLVIEGDQKVGKSLFAEFLIALFDGTGPHVTSRIDGAKLMKEKTRQFTFGQIEGCRIVSLKELPEGSGRSETASLISTVKQMVDAGSGGDYVDIERKGIDCQSVENHSYLIATTNHENVIPLEDQNRRILVARFGITQANKPGDWFYDRLGAILDDPERLAAIWDYLSAREIGGYRASDNPPVTAEAASYQLRGLPDPVRHMAVAIGTLEHAGRGTVTLADIVPLMNLAGRIEARERGDWDGERDLYRVGSPVEGAVAGTGPSAVRGKALDYLGERTRKRETKVGRGRGQKRAPTVYALKGCTAPIEDMQWVELTALLERERERHPVREGVRAKPYDVPIEGLTPVVDRIAGEDEADLGLEAARSNAARIAGADRTERRRLH